VSIDCGRVGPDDNKERISMRSFLTDGTQKYPRAHNPGVRQCRQRKFVKTSISLPLSFMRATIDFADFKLTVGIMYTTVTDTEDVLRFK
jgi:hypothetical protein